MNCRFTDADEYVTTNILFDPYNSFEQNRYPHIDFALSSNFNGYVELPEGVTNFSSTFLGCYNFNQPVTVPASASECSLMFRDARNFHSSVKIENKACDASYICYRCGTFGHHPSAAVNWPVTYINSDYVGYHTMMFYQAGLKVIFTPPLTYQEHFDFGDMLGGKLYTPYALVTEFPTSYELKGIFGLRAVGEFNYRFTSNAGIYYLDQVPDVNCLRNVISCDSLSRVYYEDEISQDYEILFVCKDPVCLQYASSLQEALFYNLPNWYEFFYDGFYSNGYIAIFTQNYTQNIRVKFTTKQEYNIFNGYPLFNE